MQPKTAACEIIARCDFVASADVDEPYGVECLVGSNVSQITTLDSSRVVIHSSRTSDCVCKPKRLVIFDNKLHVHSVTSLSVLAQLSVFIRGEK